MRFNYPIIQLIKALRNYPVIGNPIQCIESSTGMVDTLCFTETLIDLPPPPPLNETKFIRLVLPIYILVACFSPMANI